MDEIIQKIMGVTIVIFMVGNLLEVGLKLKVEEALAALRNVRFVCFTLLWCFVLGPALSFLLTKIIPLSEPYARLSR
jgi:bile acid:Na+ symporter, BASS family